MKRISLAISVMAVVLAIAHGEPLTIIGFDHDGGIEFQGATVSNYYTLEFAPAVDGPWTNWGSLSDQPITSTVMRCSSPMFYRIRMVESSHFPPYATVSHAHSNITASMLASSAVETSKIADGAVTGTKLATAAVDGSKIAAGSVGTSHIGDAAVTDSKLSANAVTTTRLASGAVTQEKIAGSAVSSPQLATGAVTEPKLAAQSVTGSKLATGSVGSAAIVDGAVTQSKLGNSAVTSGKISDSAVATPKIADGAVTATKLSAGAVNSTHVANSAIGSSQLANGSVTEAKMSVSGGLVAGLNADMVDGLHAAVLAQGGISKIVRGTYSLNATSGSTSFSPSVTPTKCAVHLRAIANGSAYGLKVPAVICTSLTATQIGFQKMSSTINIIVEYQIIEYE